MTTKSAGRVVAGVVVVVVVDSVAESSFGLVPVVLNFFSLPLMMGTNRLKWLFHESTHRIKEYL
jgi:hypothetical protein